jgi:hypothetical protein
MRFTKSEREHPNQVKNFRSIFTTGEDDNVTDIPDYSNYVRTARDAMVDWFEEQGFGWRTDSEMDSLVGALPEDGYTIVGPGRGTDEQHFLAYVRSHREIGYGRMMQMISHEWFRTCRREETPTSGVLVANECLGLLSKDEQRLFERQAEQEGIR